jgi:hypothetical protein
MISVAACAGDESAVAASVTNCRNFKASFTGDNPALPRRAMHMFRSALINPCDGGFNPSDIVAAHN